MSAVEANAEPATMHRSGHGSQSTGSRQDALMSTSRAMRGILLLPSFASAMAAAVPTAPTTSNTLALLKVESGDTDTIPVLVLRGGGQMTVGSACSEGEWNCMTTSFQRCASGQWSVVMDTADGTICVGAPIPPFPLVHSRPVLLRRRPKVTA